MAATRWTANAGALTGDVGRHSTSGPAILWKPVWLHVVLPTAIGTGVYLLFRTPTLLVFDWLDAVGLCEPVMSMRRYLSDVQPPDWLLYSLPDGIWVYAATAWLAIIWRRSPCWPWLSVPVVLAVGTEAGQAIGLVPGTHQHLDVVFYVGGFLLALLQRR